MSTSQAVLMLSDVFTTAVAFAYAFYRTYLYPLYFSPLRKITGPTYAGPFLGHFWTVIASESGTIARQWVKEYGPIIRTVGPLGKDWVFVFKPEALQKILVNDWTNYPRPNFLRDMLGIVAGYGLLTVTGNEHRQMRRAINPAFSLSNIMAQTDIYFDSIDVYVSFLGRSQVKESKERVVPMYEWMSKVTLDIICDTAFGYRSNSLRNPNGALVRAYETLIALQSGPTLAKFIFIVSLPLMPTLINHRTFGPLLAPLFRFVPGVALFETLVKSTLEIRKISRELLRERVAESGVDVEDTSSKRDILSLLVRARKGENDGYTLSDDDLVDQVLTFLGAGHETTASGLSWALWLLATHPEVQDELRAELAPIFAASPRPDYRDMKDLKVLECVVMESLRLFPPVPLTFREAARDDWVDGTFIPKGTLFYLSIRAVNTWEPVWGPDAEVFRPSRWLDLPPAYNPSYSLLSFIAGPHACIGKTMAISEMKIVLAAMIANFEFRPAYEGQVAKPTAAITMKPEDNMPLLVRRVNSSSDKFLAEVIH
ncbi:cytochrome P450 [Vararia minispora EC-137]|uniref:Cytochrome P450 n=1 Tax=Vararia minispora EC-137 TaxID=1314806 RepID=A0ACB8QE45_9AGAM|nr:cytochrome P450 [Vararia minispora EC-137]